MKAVAVAVVATTFLGFGMPAAQAQSRLKDCAAQWSAMKAAQQTAGKTYRAFQKECMSASSSLSKEAGADDIKVEKQKKKRAAKTASEDTAPNSAKKTSPAREAATARRRECSAEWKAEKAAGKIAEGMKWPQFFSACNARKKSPAA